MVDFEGIVEVREVREGLGKVVLVVVRVVVLREVVVVFFVFGVRYFGEGGGGKERVLVLKELMFRVRGLGDFVE